MKYLLTLFTIFLFASGLSFSQGGNYHKNREEIKKKKYEYIVKNLQLTEKEQKEFIPLYKEFELKKESLYDQKRKLMRSFKQNNLNLTKEELTKMIDKYVDLDVQIAQQGKVYYNKFKKVLPPMKILLLHQTENDFKRLLLRGTHGRSGKKHP